MSEASFRGLHPDWSQFLTDLKSNNEKAFWEVNKHRYREHLRGPMEALAADLEGSFGEAHFYRPYRDLRFSRDKRPYKLHLGVSFGGRGPSAIGGRYVQLDLGGLYVGGGAYALAPEALAVYRRAVADPGVGANLQAVVSDLAEAGYDIVGESLKRVPRGFEAAHPHAELLKRKGVFAAVHFAPADWFYTPEALTRVAQVFADVEPLVSWFHRHCYAGD